jgi:broad specificity phosphatase PhoE
MTIIYFLRHGKTDDTGQRITGYRSGIHLNETGRAQAERAAESLCKFPIRAIYASPLERTIETAEVLASRIHLTVVPQEFLKEIHFGELQGLGEELSALPVWQQFLTHPAQVQFPGGESVRDAQQRIVAGLDELAAEYSQEDRIVCVGHCEIIRLALAHCLRIPLDDYMRLTIDPASISCTNWQRDIQSVNLLNFVPRND